MAKLEAGSTMSLKIFVDTNTNKVVFAEAGREFVDFLFSLMSLPLSSVSKLLNGKDNLGCFGALCQSIKDLDYQYYEIHSNKDLALKPRAFATIPLLSLNDAPTSLTFYQCKLHQNKYISDRKGSTCPLSSGIYACGSSLSEKRTCEYVINKDGSQYVKGVVPYIVMDNLEVKPMSMSLIMSLVKDFDSVEEREAEVGSHEGLALLKASLEKQDALTTVFLASKRPKKG